MIHKRILIYCAIIFCSLLFNSASAIKAQKKNKIRFPIGCKQLGYKFDFYNVIFTPSNKVYPQTVYFIKNISNRTIRMLHVHNGDEPYIVHVDGTIAPNRWSVLAVSEPKIKYVCTNYNKRKNDHRVINCKNILDICEFPRARFGTNHRGTYWLAVNQSRRSAVRATRYHGVLLTDHRQPQEQ